MQRFGELYDSKFVKDTRDARGPWGMLGVLEKLEVVSATSWQSMREFEFRASQRRAERYDGDIMFRSIHYLGA